MKKIIILIVLIVPMYMLGQLPSVEIDSADISPDTYSNPKMIVISLHLNFAKLKLDGYILEDKSIEKLNTNLKFELVSKKFPTIITQKESISISVNPKKLTINISNVSDTLVKLLDSDNADIYLKSNKDIVLLAYHEDKKLPDKKIKLSKVELEKGSRSRKILTESMAEEYINAKGGEIFISQNQIDFGAIPSKEAASEKTEFFANFKLRNKYNFMKKSPLYYYVEGLVSTNAKDSANYLSIYPINLNLLEGNNEIGFQLGLDGNQNFTQYRISGNFFWSKIIPNLVDFTFGENRMRLKPVIKLGLKIYNEFENNRRIVNTDNEFSNQVFADFYYNVPIKKNYTLIFESSLFYDFSTVNNPDKKLMARYSATLGLDIPKTDLKTIVKYSWGENGISYKSNETLMIGFIVDLIGIDKESIPGL